MNDRSEAHRVAARLQIFRVLRDTKWMIAVSILVSLVLYAPDQLREIYRIVYADLSFVGLVRAFLPVLLIAVMCWLAAHQVAQASAERMPPGSAGQVTAQLLPPLLGALPLLACAAGQYDSRPNRFGEADVLNVVGSTWESYDVDLASTVGNGLDIGAASLAALALLAAGMFWHFGRRLQPQSCAVNLSHLGRTGFLVAVLLLMLGLTLAYVLSPLALPRFFGVFGILATFVLCGAAFALYFSLLTLRHRFPFIPLILAVAFVLSIFDFNDNHQVRLLQPGADTPPPPDARPTAWEEFKSWHKSRPDLAGYPEYPVYIVTAQGGGIYAAYQTALFLARLQDQCPAFRHHLFAISSVSGGSLGAATFASLMNANPPPPVPARTAQPAGPCPAIDRYLRTDRQPPPDSDKPGPLETAVGKVLAHDFLSPLVASTLFPDFLQRFLMVPIASFDRARVLEAAFEQAMRDLQVERKPVFERSFLAHWDAKASSPALLMNATDAGSGRRYLFSPFDIWTGVAAKGVKSGSLVHFDFSNQLDALPAKKEGRPRRTLDLRLSSVVGVSARFPWMTPAATFPIDDFEPSKLRKIRLVDGGYVDNSGVETALDLIQSLTEEMETVRDEGNEGRRLSSVGRTPSGKVRLSLIVLSGGGFPVRGSFALGETLEPVRTFLSTRESRAYAAIERANRTLQPQSIATLKQHLDPPITVMANVVKTTSLTNQFYDMPLGWTLSDRTRDIIARQSGRYWDCDPDENFEQTGGFPATDCIQLLVYHELNQSLAAAGTDIGMSKYASSFFSVAEPRFSHQGFIRCYRDKADSKMTLQQARNLQALLRVWDANPAWDNGKDAWLAYLLAAVDQETDAFSPQYALRLQADRTARRHFGELLGIDLQNMPALMLMPEVAARIAIVRLFFPEERFKMFEDAFETTPPDWAAVRKLDGVSADTVTPVERRMSVFLECIVQTKLATKPRDGSAR